MCVAKVNPKLQTFGNPEAQFSCKIGNVIMYNHDLTLYAFVFQSHIL